MAISAGPLFKFNPSISMMVNFDPAQDKDARKRIDDVWEKLSEGGTALMPLDNYPFSERYGWIQDKYGFSWQLIYTDPEGEERPLIIPSLLFVTDTGNKAEAATDFYLSVFKNAKRGSFARYPAGMEPNKEGSIMFTDFKLEGQSKGLEPQLMLLWRDVKELAHASLQATIFNLTNHPFII